MVTSSGNGSLTFTPLSPPTVNPATLTVNGTANSASGNALAGDSPSYGSTLTVTAVDGQAAAVGQAIAGQYGTLDLDSNGTYTYTPTVKGLVTGQSDTDAFNFTVTDSAYGSQTTTLAITIDGVTHPIGAAQTGASSTTITDEQIAKPFSGVMINDVNAAQTETAVVSVNTAANGTLSDPNAGTDHSTISNGAITIIGSAAAVATDLDGLMFTPTAHQVAPGMTVPTTITAAISDTAGEQTSIASTVIATAVNDAPVISGIKAGQTTQDTAAVKPFTTASVSDVDTGVQDSLTIVLSNAANGTLSGTGLTASSTAGTYTLAAAAPATLTSDLQALTFTPAAHEAAAGSTVTTTFALTASQTAGNTTTNSATNSGTSVVATETSAYNVINGPAGGHAKIYGTSGNDQITAFSTQNQIYGEGGNDLINAGAGEAIVSLGNGNSSVTLGGSTNGVIGGTGNTSVTGGSGGYNAVALGNGNDTVTVGGTHDVIVLGTGTDMVSGTQGMSFITTGGGNDTIVLGGSGNTVSAGGGNNTISGGTGSNTFILPGAGQGFDAIAGFTETNGDVLNLHAALQETNWNGKANTLSNYVKVHRRRQQHRHLDCQQRHRQRRARRATHQHAQARLRRPGEPSLHPDLMRRPLATWPGTARMQFRANGDLVDCN